MNFEQLRRLLVVLIREKIRNGEWTERCLAKQSRISQPHLHNVLKGVRVMSPGMADRLLETARLNVRDLLDRGEMTTINDGNVR